MSQRCPDCQKPLGQFAVTCENCGWSLTAALREQVDADPHRDDLKTGYDLHYHAANEAIERGDFQAAIVSINRSLKDATPQQRCEATALRGYASLKQGDFAAAEAACSEAIRSGWADSRTLAWRAAARSSMDRYPETMNDLSEAVAIANGDEDEYLVLLSTYGKRAREHYSAILAENPQNVDSFWQRGWVHLRAGMLDRAERDFKSCLQLDDQQGWAWVGLAHVHLEMEQFESAVKLATRAVGEESIDIRRDALSIRARAWARIGGGEACFEDLEELSQLAGECTEWVFRLAHLRFDLQLYSATITDCDVILKREAGFIPALLLRGMALSRIGNLTAALKDLSAFVHAFPQHAQGLTERARVLTNLNELDRALADLQIALRMQPKSQPAHVARARVFLAQKQHESALAAVEKVEKLEPQNAEAAEIRGRVRFAESDFQSAVDEYSRAIDFSKTLNEKAECLFLRGITFYELGQFDMAAGDFESACNLRPHHAGSWIWMAAVDSRRENWANAIQSLQRAIAYRPTAARHYLQLGRPVARKAVAYFSKLIQRGQGDGQIHRNRGIAFHFLGEIESAIADYNVALDHCPDDLETRVRRGQLHQRQGEHKSAIKDFSYVIHRDKIHHLVRYYRAMSWFSVGLADRALSDVLKAIELDPRQAKYHVLRGEMVQREGRLPRAIRCYDRAIALDPQNAVARRLRGLALMEMQEYSLGLLEIKRAIELEPDQAEHYVAKGQLLLKTSQFADAERAFEKAIIRNPKHLKAYLGRSSALIAQGKFRETVIWLTKSLHQFTSPLALSEVLLKRGRAFYRMGLAAYAVSDFTTCIRLLTPVDHVGAATARFARGLAFVQRGEYESARHDFSKLKKHHADSFPSLNAMLAWIENRSLPTPPDVYQPERMQKMPKPRVVRAATKLLSDGKEWEVSPPYDTWVLRAGDQEYGPVPKSTLDRWMEQGRITTGMKVVRGDWPKWKHVEKIYRDLLDPSADSNGHSRR